MADIDDLITEIHKLNQNVERLIKTQEHSKNIEDSLLYIYKVLVPPNTHNWYDFRYDHDEHKLYFGEHNPIQFKEESLEEIIISKLFFQSGKSKRKKFPIEAIASDHEFTEESVIEAVKRIKQKIYNHFKRDDIVEISNGKIFIKIKKFPVK